MNMNVSVKSLYEQLQSRGIEVEAVSLPDSKTLLLFDYAGALRAIQGSIPDATSATGVVIVNNKQAAAVAAGRLGIPLPATIRYDSPDEAESFLEQQRRVVVKPLDGAHGNGVSTDITSVDELHRAIERAREFSSIQLIQQQVTGVDLRILVIDGQPIAIAERVPASITGDGEHTIGQLIDIENTTNPDRGVNYQKPLNIISIDGAHAFLGERIHDIPEKDQVVQVVGTANLGTGGTIVNRTNDTAIPSEMIDQAVLFARQTGLFCAGLDFMFDATTREWNFIEANSSPNFAVHWHPINGEGIAVEESFVAKLLAHYDATATMNQNRA